jgi:hypothetical protein
LLPRNVPLIICVSERVFPGRVELVHQFLAQVELRCLPRAASPRERLACALGPDRCDLRGLLGSGLCLGHALFAQVSTAERRYIGEPE